MLYKVLYQKYPLSHLGIKNPRRYFLYFQEIEDKIENSEININVKIKNGIQYDEILKIPFDNVEISSSSSSSSSSSNSIPKNIKLLLKSMLSFEPNTRTISFSSATILRHFHI